MDQKSRYHQGPPLTPGELMEWEMWCHTRDSRELKCWIYKVLCWALDEYHKKVEGERKWQEMQDEYQGR